MAPQVRFANEDAAAAGRPARNAAGREAATRVTLRPGVESSGAKLPTAARAEPATPA